MPRVSSVILSAAEKKAKVVELKQALKKQASDVAAISAEAKAAAKAVEVAEKAKAKAVAEAKKAQTKTEARVAKMLAAAAKGREKLEATLASVEAVEVPRGRPAAAPAAAEAPKRRGRPPKAAVVETAEASPTAPF